MGSRGEEGGEEGKSFDSRTVGCDSIEEGGGRGGKETLGRGEESAETKTNRSRRFGTGGREKGRGERREDGGDERVRRLKAKERKFCHAATRETTHLYLLT